MPPAPSPFSPVPGSAPAASHARGDDAVWAALIPDDQWTVFAAGAEAARRAGVEFLLGGAMALAAHTDHWRNTKDIDFIVRARDHEAMVEALRAAGFSDYYEQEAYDRSWIFRGFRDGVILDIIWELPNHRVDVDEAWFDYGAPVQLHGAVYRAVSAEDMVRVKLYVLQRQRCDWVDVLNVLAAAAEKIDWDRLVARMGPELPLLQAVLTIFSWMCPGRVHAIPAALRERFALPEIQTPDPAAMEVRRVRLLDSRPWFAVHQPTDRPLEL